MGGSLQFNGSGSTDPDGSIVTYLWDFGDGTTASTASPTHTFATAGTYTVKLTVTDNTGLTGSAQTTVTVTVPPPDPPPATGGDGAGLYGQYCASCHGAMGQHGSAGSVAGDDAEDIAEAIREVPDMWTLKGVLTTEQIQAIATYLASADGGMDRGDDDDRDGSGKKDKKKKCKDGTKSKNKKKCKKPKRRDDD
jgi:PKD repeat protein